MRKILVALIAAILCAGVLAACSSPAPATDETSEQPAAEESTAAPEKTSGQPAVTEPPATPAMDVVSAAITDGVLSDEYGMRGAQQADGIPTLSPPLTVSNIPKGTAALAVTVIDPDGGDWVHWLCCFVPGEWEPAQLQENASIADAKSLKQGENDFGTLGYGGPTPPGGVHSYVFTVYALADVPELWEGFDLEALTNQLTLPGMVLAEATVTATYAH